MVLAAACRPRRRSRRRRSCLTRGSGGPLSVSPNSVGVIDPRPNELVAEVPVGRDPGAIADRRGRRLGRERRGRDGLPHRSGRSRTRVATIPVGGYPSDITVGNGSVWVAFGRGQLRRIDPLANEGERPTTVGPDMTR